MNLLKILCLMAALILSGCGDSNSEKTVDTTGPLTVEEWKDLPVSLKYDERSFERLKENDKELQTKKGWDKFMREVVVPERKKDIPGIPGEED